MPIRERGLDCRVMRRTGAAHEITGIHVAAQRRTIQARSTACQSSSFSFASRPTAVHSWDPIFRFAKSSWGYFCSDIHGESFMSDLHATAGGQLKQLVKTRSSMKAHLSALCMAPDRLQGAELNNERTRRAIAAFFRTRDSSSMTYTHQNRNG